MHNYLYLHIHVQLEAYSCRVVVVNLLTFPAGSPKGQCGVNLVLDLDECVQYHRTTVVQVYCVFLHLWLVSRLVWILCERLRG